MHHVKNGNIFHVIDQLVDVWLKNCTLTDKKKIYLDICDTYMSKYLNRKFIIYQVLFTQIQREKASRRHFKRKKEKERCGDQ